MTYSKWIKYLIFLTILLIANTSFSETINLDIAGSYSSPRISPDCTKIVFCVWTNTGTSRNSNNQCDIFSINADGSNPTKLTTEAGIAKDPSWSPDGKYIYYSSNINGSYDIWVMDATGQNKKRLSTDDKDNEEHPVCSSINYGLFSYNNLTKTKHEKERYGKLVFSKLSGDRYTGRSDLWEMKVDGSNQKQITNNNIFPDCKYPEWSADGLSILFSYGYGEFAILKRYPYPWESNQYWEYNKLPLKKGAAYSKQYTNACWSPNKENILIQIGNTIDITDLTCAKIEHFANGSDPNWSNDGKKVVYVKDGKLEIIDSNVPLSDVVNLYKFTQKEGYYIQDFFFNKDKHAAKLVNNGFIVIPANFNQFYTLYDQVNYFTEATKPPMFVSSDSLLHLFHIYFDASLKRMEEEFLFAKLVTLSKTMLNLSLEQYNQVKGKELKMAAEKNVIFFGVANNLLKIEVIIPNKLKKEILAYTKEIEAHVTSGIPIDYTQFIIRGHYNDSDNLKKYFLTMMWYSQYKYTLKTDIDLKRLLLIANALFKDTNLPLWKDLYDPIKIFVGDSEDICVSNLQGWVDVIYKNDLSFVAIDNKTNLDALRQQINSFPKPRISPFEGVTFRFMPQRFTPDSYIMQSLVYRNITQEPIRRMNPTGLDVMAVLGSERAYNLLDKVLNETTKYTPASDYPSELLKLKKEFALIDEKTWKQNLYWGWLYALKGYFDKEVNKELHNICPAMLTDAWADKELYSSLASWTELKHDTILYGKMGGAEAMGDILLLEFPIIPKPEGFIEPNILVYKRLKELLGLTHGFLEKNNFNNNQVFHTSDSIKSYKDEYDKIAVLIDFFVNISEKELKGQNLTEEEYDKVAAFGGELEKLSKSIEGEGKWQDPEGNKPPVFPSIALVADVFNNSPQDFVLEEGVGNVHLLYVIIKRNGKKYLTVGGNFSYYEFLHPMQDRLTDEKWRKMLKDGKAPALPIWTNNFMEQ
ncbi:MAG: DUF3160 domain-containing protein [bacterium]|nr:DUF3160 domain-containing protein [bacterium]MDD5756192.1 DUF3160 domain-containing protein [bacterium]